MDFILTLLLILSFSFLLGKIFEKIRLPKILAPIFIGILFNIFSKNFNLNINRDIFELLSNLTIILLLFYIGLSIDFKSLKKEKGETILVGVLGFVISFILGFILTYFILKLSFLVSFIVSTTLSITAEGIMVILLEENRLIESKVGNVILGAGIIDDIIGILFLVIISFLTSLGNLTIFYLFSFIVLILIFLLFNFLSKKIETFLGDFFLDIEKKDLYDVFTFSIIFVLLLANFFNYIGFDFTIGAIFAGLILNLSLNKKGRKGRKEELLIDKFIKSITFGFLSYFFFFWIGYNIDVNFLFKDPFLGLLFALVGFTGKVFASFISGLLNNVNIKDSWLIGIGMSTKGAVELIVAEIARKTHIISPEIFSAIVFMGIFLTIIPTILFNYNVRLFKKEKSQKSLIR